MPRIITTLEIASTSIKTVSGYVLDGQTIVLHSETVSLDNGAMKDCEIQDYGLVVKAINQAIKSTSDKLNTQVSEIVLVIPSIGLEIFQHQQTTSVVSPVGQIARIDIENVRSQVSKAKVSDGTSIVDIIPDVYIMDHGESFEPPIDQISNSLTIKAKLHAVPTVLVSSYKKVVSQANLRISRIIVESYASCEALKVVKNIPSDYILVDLGARLTVASLIGRGQVYAAAFGYNGSNLITESVAQKFTVDFNSAQHLKEKFGYDNRPTGYETPIMTLNDDNGKIKKVITNKEFTQGIKPIIENYAIGIKNIITELKTSAGIADQDFPIILVGGGSKLFGITEVVNNTLKPKQLAVVSCDIVGARDPKYLNCVGALKIFGSYKKLEETDPYTEDLTDYELNNSRRIKLNRNPIN